MKTIIKTKKLKAVGPYSLAIQKGRTLYMSGQIGIDENKKLVSNDTLNQFKRIMINLQDLLESSEFTNKDIVNVKIYLKDVNDFAKINEEYKKFFKQPYPTRSTIGVADLPLNAKIEIDFLAVK